MLRQYFMALRTLGKWQKLPDDWMRVASDVHHEPLDKEGEEQAANRDVEDHRVAVTEGSWRQFLRMRLGHDKVPHDDDKDDIDVEFDPVDDENDVHDDSADSGVEVGADPDTEMDIEILLQRKFFTRWARKAGVKTCPCDPSGSTDCLVDWTRLIAPVVDGRIKMVGSQST